MQLTNEPIDLTSGLSLIYLILFSSCKISSDEFSAVTKIEVLILSSADFLNSEALLYISSKESDGYFNSRTTCWNFIKISLNLTDLIISFVIK